MGKRTDQHIVQLDGLRFFAVLMVMLAHWVQYQWTGPIGSNIPFAHGVTLFFVLSGFLISSILLTNRDEYNRLELNKFLLIRNFYVRRFFRIFPIYYILIIALFVFNFDNTREIFPWLITYTSNIYQSIHNVGINRFNHFWSLGVEEQFYLFWPLVLLFVKPSRSLALIVFTIVLALLVRTYIYVEVGHWMATSYFTLSCMHALGLGALLSYILRYNERFAQSMRRPLWIYVSCAAYLVLLVIQKVMGLEWYEQIFDEFVFAICCTFIILRASGNGFRGLSGKILENRFVVYSGKISYGLYVYHLFIPVLMDYVSEVTGYEFQNNYQAFVAYYLVTFVIAHFSWILIERPINSLKQKVPYVALKNE